MGKFRFLILCQLFFSGFLYSQSHGLQFSSHDVLPEQRTSLNLTPNEPLCLKEDTRIAFDFKLTPNNQTYFGYILRIITTNGQNIDVVSKQKSKGFSFIIGDLFSNNFIIDSSKLFGEWNQFAIEFNTKLQEVLFYVNDKLICKSKLNINNSTCCKVVFGTNTLEQFMTIDVPPMQVKDISIKINKKEQHFFPLSETTGIEAKDVIGKKVAVVNNPVWVKPLHQNWKQINTIETAGTPSIAFDKDKEILYIISVDSLLQLSIKTNQLTGVKLSKRMLKLPLGNQSIFDPTFKKLYNVYIDEKIVWRYDTTSNSWQDRPFKSRLTEFWQANKFISSLDSSLYIFGGYGQNHYKNLIQRYKFSQQKWEIITPKGDFFMPRYLAALGTNEASDTVYLMGGYGSKTGDQAINPKHIYELIAYHVKDQSFEHIYNFKQPEKEFCFANSLVIDAVANQFYGLIHPINRSNSSLQMIRGSLRSPDFELVGDSIPYFFHDIESFSDLYYCPISKKMVAVTLLNRKGQATIIKTFTLDFPPNSLIISQPVNADKNDFFWIFVIVFVIVFLIAIVLGFKKWLKPSQQSEPVSKPDLQANASLQPIALEEITSNQGLYEMESKRSIIFLFGHFEVIDKEGNDITSQFTPLLKEMFLMILLYTFKDGKGIFLDQLFETLWVDKPLKDARNNFSVNIVKLKTILEKVGTSIITKDSGKWRFEILNESIKLDYVQFILLVNEKPAVIDINYISKLLIIINRGAFLREVQYDWMDDIKANVSSYVINSILAFTATTNLAKEPEFILKLANCIFHFDQMNETALELKCRSLIKLGKPGIAKETYLHFTKNFEKNYGQEFERTYIEIIQQ